LSNSGGSGGINVDNFLPNDAGIARQVSQNLASEVASGACKLGSATTQTACGVINAAAEQIKQSILTGNNDWATCVGTAQIGACIGSRIGSGGWTNNNGVERASTGTDRQTGKQFDYKGCCLCRLEQYEAGYVYNTIVGSYDVISVIQAGDFNTGSCRYRENKGYFKRATDPKHSYRYQNCRKKYVAGQICAPNSRGQAQVWQGSQIGYRPLIVKSF
jgi:hypothetical protein